MRDLGNEVESSVRFLPDTVGDIDYIEMLRGSQGLESKISYSGTIHKIDMI